MSKQQTGAVIVTDDQLSVHGQRARTRSESFWTYYSTTVGILYKVFCSIFIVIILYNSSCFLLQKSSNENQQQTGIIQKNKNPVTTVSLDKLTIVSSYSPPIDRITEIRCRKLKGILLIE